MSQRFINILNIHELGKRKKQRVGYPTAEQSEQGSSNMHVKKAKLNTLAFRSLNIQDTIMADENQIDGHRAQK